MRYLNLPLELKALNDDGTFSGYAAIFGNVDFDGDVIERGALKEVVRNGDGKVVVLWQHRQGDPIGVADVTEDSKGLKFEGALVLEDPTARRARAHMIAKSVRGMSIGFDTLKDEIREGIRYIKELRLWEISLVTFGANPVAGVDAVKSLQIATIREFEDRLRDEFGYSNRQAKLLASGGWAALQAARDETGDAEVKQLIETFRQFVPTS